jgi:lipopolysaccharide/colanic/teichoic acid biosynthesis glycosyltransferase
MLQSNDVPCPITDSRRAPDLAKRTLDIIVGALGMLVLAALFPALWLAIRLDSRGPAIFRQWRVGQNGQLFCCYKFRTMDCDADDLLHRRAFQQEVAGQRISEDPDAPFKLSGDPRVTRVGRWLRETSLDELPQLVNVLRGDMSIVGPRPMIPYELECFQVWHHKRHDVRPGLTGPWQVWGRGRMSVKEMLELDLEYAFTWTIWTDLKLIALTIPAVLKRNGAQ